MVYANCLTWPSPVTCETFFLYKVLEKKHANEHISDDNDHNIPGGNKCMVYNYLKKTFENFRQGHFQYKLIEKQKVYIIYNHVLYLEVLISLN